MKFANWNLQEAVRLATLNPARASRMPENMGMLVAGARADIVALSPEGEVRHTMVGGQIT
jgi:N-acetylglucosamine-6-phosphate deacetylase